VTFDICIKGISLTLYLKRYSKKIDMFFSLQKILESLHWCV